MLLDFSLEQIDPDWLTVDNPQRKSGVRSLLLFLHAVVTLRLLDVELLTPAKNNNALP